MEALPASAEALELLVASGDDGIRARVAWIRGNVLDVAPYADCMAIWFADEDLTLFHQSSEFSSPRGPPRARRSSLALRFATASRVVAVVTLYSHRADAFAGRVGLVERGLGAVVGASILDQDLDVRSYRHAEAAPAQLRARKVIDTAVGLLMGTAGVSEVEADEWLARAARTSDRSVLAVASQVVAAHHVHVDDDPSPQQGEQGSMTGRYMLCRIAYEATEHDPTTRDRRLKDFPGATMAAAESAARQWATDRNRLRTSSDRMTYPWVLERWNDSERAWEVVSHIR